ncbi:MAG: transcriptional regulator with XRE-family HTH domain [Rhodothermales bacterium]|jgi:transcriptional regulator with XRE-family HTH domain
MPRSILFQTDPEIVSAIGSRLRELRKARRLTIEEASEQAELNPSTVVRAEQGRNPTLMTLLRLLRVYGELGGIENLIPEPSVSPLAVVRERRERYG